MWRQLWESNPGHPLTTVGMKTQVENFKKWKNSLVYFPIDYLVWGVDQTRLMLFTLGFKAKKSIKEGQIVTLPAHRHNLKKTKHFNSEMTV